MHNINDIADQFFTGFNSGLYWIFEMSNSLSPVYQIRLLPILTFNCYS